MKFIRHIIYILPLLLCNYNLYCQIPDHLGNGNVKIMMYAYVKQDTVQLDNPSRIPFMEIQYFIKDSKVLRNDIYHEISNSITAHGTTSQSLSAKVWVPSYIIDWKRKNSTIFLIDGDSTFYVDTLLAGNDFDIFYKRLATALEPFCEIDTSVRKEILFNGQRCFEGRYRFNSGWRSFYYTKEKVGFYSPLNAILPKFDFPIIKIDTDSTDDPIDKTKITGIVRFEISYLSNDIQDKKMFIIPKNSKKLTFSSFRNKIMHMN